MSYFVSAYDVFIPLYSIAVTGLSVATSRSISEAAATRRQDHSSLLATARLLFLLIGILCALALFLLSGVLTNAIGNPGARLAVCMIAPSLIFSCSAAAYRGYFQGQSNMLPTAKSQVIEAVVKLLTGVGAAFFLYRYLSAQTAAGEAPAWLQGLPPQEASLKIMMISAAGAVLGVTISTLAGMIFMSWTYRRNGTAKKARFSMTAAKELLRIALPIAASSAVANLTTLIDLSSVMNCLTRAVKSGAEIMLRQYSGLLPPEVTADVIPEYLYGCYSGLAMSIFNLVPALTAGIGISAIPVIASHFWRGDKSALSSSFRSAMLTTAIIAFPAGIGIYTLPEQILLFLYPYQTMEVTIVVPILKVMGISTIFVAFSAVMNNILQAVGKEKIPLYALLAGGIIKLITNYSLVSRVDVNIHGVAYGTLFCYAFIFLFCSAALLRSGFRLADFSVLLKPFAAALLCGICAKTGYDILIRVLSRAPALLLSVLFAAIVYFIAVFSMKCLKTADFYFTFYQRKKRK